MIGVKGSITNKVRSSCKLVVDNAKYVKINFDALNNFVSEFSNELKNWDNQKFLDPELHYVDDPLKAIWYFFVLDTVNFCFWADNEIDKWTVYYRNKELSGYKALAVCLKKEAENSSLFIYPYYWAKLFKYEFMRMIYPSFEDLFYLRGQLKLIDERVTNLRELGENIFQKPISELFKSIFWKDIKYKNFQGVIKEEEEDPYKLSYNDKNDPRKIVDIIVSSNKDVNLFIENVVNRFASYKDTANYQLRNGNVIDVFFFKRAQLLAHDLYLLYNYYYQNKPDIVKNNPYLDYLNFRNIKELTAFADYKLPQFLYSKGILVYSEDLAKEIDNKNLIPAKDIKEVEIRAATIIAVEEIAIRTKTYPAFIDNILWNLAKNQTNLSNHHRTITIYY